MDLEKREYIISRIIWGFLPFKYCGFNYLIGQPDSEDIFYAEQSYWDTLEDCKFDGIMSEAQLRNWMIEEKLWSIEEEKSLETINKDIEELKVQLFQCITKSNEKMKIREYLKIAKTEHARLTAKKHSHDYISKEGMAKSNRSNYLISKSIYDSKKRKIDDATIDLVSCAIKVYHDNLIDDVSFRELARTEPWRSIWSSDNNVFGIPSSQLSAERRNLIMWSKMYDNIYEHPECPHSSIVEDDDCIDGWMILQKRKREKDQQKQDAESLITNEKIKNAGEIFIFADTREDAAKIDSLNNPASRMIKQQRERYILQKGVTDLMDLPDVRNDLNSQAHQAYVDKVKGT